MCNGYLYDTMLAYVQGLTAAGKPISTRTRTGSQSLRRGTANETFYF